MHQSLNPRSAVIVLISCLGLASCSPATKPEYFRTNFLPPSPQPAAAPAVAEPEPTPPAASPAFELAQLRADKAQLLGYPDYASFTMSDQMAKNPATAIGFMEGLVPALAAQQGREVADINAMIRKTGGKFTVQPWDWDFYADKVRKQKYAYDESQVKPYFEITNVLENGVFFAAHVHRGLLADARLPDRLHLLRLDLPRPGVGPRPLQHLQHRLYEARYGL